jgi:hypothetical protein
MLQQAVTTTTTSSSSSRSGCGKTLAALVLAVRLVTFLQRQWQELLLLLLVLRAVVCLA